MYQNTNLQTRRQFLKKTGTGLLSITAATSLLPILLGNREICLAQELAPNQAVWPDEETLKRVLSAAMSKGARFSDIFLERTVKRYFEIGQHKVQNIHFSIDQGAGVRVMYGEQTGYAYCEDLSADLLQETARSAAALGKSSTKSLIQPLQLLTPDTSITTQKVALGPLAEDKRISVMREAEQAALSFNPAIVDAIIEYDEAIREIMIVNSDGVMVHDVQPVIYFRLNVLAKKGDQRHMGRVRMSAKSGFELFEENSVADLARTAAREAITMLEASDSPSGEMPVVVTGGWGGVMFHEAVGHGLEGDAIAKGASFFVDKIGRKIASEIVTFIDDATLPHLRGSYNIDDEGVPAQRKVLIEKGVLKGYMHDKLSARRLDTHSTGNGRRESFRYPPMVRMSNTFILEGETSAADMIKATPKGLFAKSFDGGVVDTTTGNFTFTVREAYMIENGMLGAPVHRATLIGKGSDALQSIDLVGNDLGFGPGTCGKGQWVPVTSGQPTIRLSKIVVGGTRG